MNVFLDTNLLLDIMERRETFLMTALNVFDAGMRGRIEMYATSLTFANCMYVAKKHVGYEKALEGLRFFKKYIKIAPMDDGQCQRALNNNMPDFEDMLQFEAARAAECDVIVTRDTNRHFPIGSLPVLPPERFLNTFAEELQI